MADAAKKDRKVALGKFTRTFNTLNKLLDTIPKPPLNLVEPEYNNLKLVWTALEDAHDVYVGMDDNVADDATGFGYLDEPGERYNTVLVKEIVRWEFSTHYSRRGRFREENAFYRI